MPRFPIAGSADADVEAIRGRAVLVTGATGFIGKHLIQALVAAGAVVHGVARVLPARDRAHDGVVWHPGDVTDPLPLQEAVARAAPACVFHLAAYGTTPLQRDAGRMRATNLGGTENVWKAMAGRGARLVQTGTYAEYGLSSGQLSEDIECRPTTDYGRSLHDATSYSRSRAAATGREVVILRPFATYGPDDRPERLIPHVITTLLRGETVDATEGQQRRDYSFVSDQVAALFAAAARPLTETGRVYNVGSGEPIAVRSVVELVAAAMQAPLAQIRFGGVPSRASDAFDMFADISRARRELGFEPRVPLTEGIAQTVAWYRSAPA